MPKRLTIIEELDRNECPGLCRELGEMDFRGHGTGDLQAHILARAKQKVPRQTISHWLCTRARRREKAIERMKMQYEALGAANLSEVRRAEIFSRINEEMNNGERLSLEQAMRFELRWAELRFKQQQLEHDNRQLEVKLVAQQRAVKEATEEAERKIGKGESITIDDINRIRERTFGLPPLETAGGAANPPVPAALD